MRKQGEITVFLSLIVVCILSLCLGLLESARTTGARLYAQMAAESAAASVMSQYNRNLWDMYHILFLETESDAAIEQSFREYMNFYLAQENLYPMELDEVSVTRTTDMMEDGGVWLEESALSYVKYRLPDVAEDLAGIAEDAANASKAGDFSELFEVCRQTGMKTRKLEACRVEIEESLSDMREYLGELTDAVENESEGRFERIASKLGREMSGFSELVGEYEEEVKRVSVHLTELRAERSNEKEVVLGSEEDFGTVGYMSQELLAYEQVEEEARKQLQEYREMEQILECNLELLDEALDLLDEENFEVLHLESYTEAGSDAAGEEAEKETEQELVSVGPDWEAIDVVVLKMEIPGENFEAEIDWEKVSLLDQLEELFQGDLLTLVLPEGAEVSRNTVSLRGIPSEVLGKTTSLRGASSENISLGSEKDGENCAGALTKILVNEYCFLSFDSFLERCSRKVEIENQPLLYEQEYILCGKTSDRDNLAKTAEKLLTVRGAMNLLFLLSSPDRKTEADALALAVSGGNAPVKVLVSFLILTMWAFGEAVLDVKRLMSGGRVAFWKDEGEWELELEGLLAFQFLEPISLGDDEGRSEKGRDYKDHMRILYALMDQEERNFRMMDLIQWNVRTVQEDFSVADCICRADISARIHERHLFLLKDEYTRTVEVTGAY